MPAHRAAAGHTSLKLPLTTSLSETYRQKQIALHPLSPPSYAMMGVERGFWRYETRQRELPRSAARTAQEGAAEN
jgi:hypothetical protein